MRAALGIVLVCGVVAAVLVNQGIARRESAERGRREGLEAAERDLARGRPYIRRLLDTFDDLGPDGVGIDRGTGLPLSNTLLMCGTGVDLVAYNAEIEAYNERILAAHETGALKELTLGHKLRTAAGIELLFAEERSARLTKDGDRAEIAGGEYAVAYHYETYGDGSDYTEVTLSTRTGEPQRLRLLYPAPFDERPGTLWITGARGPFDVLVADKETTAILRDGEGFAWVVDLPRGIIIQVVGRAR